MSGESNIIIDGFTGSIALNFEGTAKFITNNLRKTLTLKKITKFRNFIVFSLKNLKKNLSKKYNGAMFLGLNVIWLKMRN